MESRPFDLSGSSQEREFAQLTNSRNWVNDTSSWYIDKLHALNKARIGSDDLTGEPVANYANFPGEIDYVFLGRTLNSQEIGLQVASKINRDPFLVFEIPNLPSTNLSIAEVLEGKFEPISEKDFNLKKSKMVSQIKSDNDVKARAMEKTFGFSENALTYEHLVKISIEVVAMRKKFENALYHKFVLDKAVDTIKSLAPSVSDVLDKVVANTVIIEATRDDEWNEHDFSAGKVGDIFFLKVNKNLKTNQFNLDHPKRIVTVGHEALHLLLMEMLEIQGNEPGYAMRTSSGNLSSLELLRYQKAHDGSLSRVILEGISMGYEYIAGGNIRKHTDKANIEEVNSAGMDRLFFLKQVNRLINPVLRKKFEHPKYHKSDLSTLAEVTYSEGAKLAIAMRRNGFGINDIPEIVKLVKKTVAEVTEQKYEGELLLQIGIDKDEYSTYHWIMRRLRNSKKIKI